MCLVEWGRRRKRTDRAGTLSLPSVRGSWCAPALREREPVCSNVSGWSLRFWKMSMLKVTLEA